jgi:hypothetical protein
MTYRTRPTPYYSLYETKPDQRHTKVYLQKIKNTTESTVSQVLVLRPVKSVEKVLKAVLRSRKYFFGSGSVEPLIRITAPVPASAP